MTHLADAGLTGRTGQIGRSKADEDGGFLYIRRLNCLHYRSECVSLYHHKNLSFGIIRLYLISGQGPACLTEHGHVRAALWCQMGGQMLGPAEQGGAGPVRSLSPASCRTRARTERFPDAGSGGELRQRAPRG